MPKTLKMTPVGNQAKKRRKRAKIKAMAINVEDPLRRAIIINKVATREEIRINRA